ncbi:MAG: hypothetical protein HC809_16030, partial [Gammaproteobacteria bacterium]|nr:hypothetical protein [Gammaproteobacteria bacterium]
MKAFAAAVVSLIWWVCAGTAAGQGVVYVGDPNPSEIMVGDTFTLEVRGKDFGSPIDGGGFDLTFDSMLL